MIGITVLALLGAYVLYRGATEVVTGGAPSVPEYSLTLPRTLENGRLELSEDLSDTFQRTSPGRGLKALGGRYEARSRGDRLVFAGYTGAIRNHERSRNKLLDGMEQNDSTEPAVPRREITPAGADESLTCQVLVKKEGGQELILPVCVWSDPDTLGAVMDNGLDALATAPDAYDLDAFAERVSGVRGEVRVPAE